MSCRAKRLWGLSVKANSLIFIYKEDIIPAGPVVLFVLPSVFPCSDRSMPTILVEARAPSCVGASWRSIIIV